MERALLGDWSQHFISLSMLWSERLCRRSRCLLSGAPFIFPLPDPIPSRFVCVGESEVVLKQHPPHQPSPPAPLPCALPQPSGPALLNTLQHGQRRHTPGHGLGIEISRVGRTAFEPGSRRPKPRENVTFPFFAISAQIDPDRLLTSLIRGSEDKLAIS